MHVLLAMVSFVYKCLFWELYKLQHCMTCLFLLQLHASLDFSEYGLGVRKEGGKVVEVNSTATIHWSVYGQATIMSHWDAEKHLNSRLNKLF